MVEKLIKFIQENKEQIEHLFSVGAYVGFVYDEENNKICWDYEI